MKPLACFSLAFFVVLGLMTPPASALTQFRKAFEEKYVAKSDNDDFKAAFKKATCNTCHVKGEKKDVRNKYGEALSELIEGDANARIKAAGDVSDEEKKAETEKILKELDKAFDEVAKKKPSDDAEKTFGEMIEGGELPVDVE